MVLAKPKGRKITKTGNEKPRQLRGDYLQTKTNAARQYKKTVPNFPTPANPKSHDNPEESIESKAQPQPEIDTKIPKHGFQMARKRHLKKATPAPWRASFFEAFLRVAFFQAKTLFELLQQASNRKPESPNRARKATTAPRRAFANEKPRDEIIKEICAKSHPKEGQKATTAPRRASKAKVNRSLGIASQKPPRGPKRYPEGPRMPPGSATSNSLRRTRCVQLAVLCFHPWPGGMREAIK